MLIAAQTGAVIALGVMFGIIVILLIALNRK